MGDVEETLTAVRESIPGEDALLELQVWSRSALSRATGLGLHRTL